MKEFVQWTAPSPLWEKAIKQPGAAERRAELSRPGILRFATDSFMDDFLKMLETDARKLDQYVALHETWRGISAPPETLKPVPVFAREFHRLGLAAKRKKSQSGALAQTSNQVSAATQTPVPTLKLYQPAHQRFYLIAACLVCERPGLPDKTFNAGREEKVSFVLRRLFPPGDLKVNDPLPALDSKWEEHAFVITDRGARWTKIEKNKELKLIENEEQLPLFGVDFKEVDGRRRKLYAGVIPAGRREAYMAAANSADKAEVRTDPLEMTESELRRDSRVITVNSIWRDPWKSLLQSVAQAKTAIAEKHGEDRDQDQPNEVINNILKAAREQAQAISWLILLDFAEYLQKNVPNVWTALKGDAATLSAAETKLKDAILATKPNAAFLADINGAGSKFLNNSAYQKDKVILSMKEALVKIAGANASGKPYADGLESVAVSYNRLTPDAQFPDFLFPLADPEFNLQTNLGSGDRQITPTDFTRPDVGFAGETVVNDFAAIFKEIYKTVPNTQPLQATPLAAEVPMDMREGFYVIRCVYERPLCGALDPPVISNPTDPFQIAGFFDPDAPARPIRIALPVDTTPAGLRKFNKNTAFMMSDLLCGQVSRMKGITFGDLIRSVLPFPLHKDLSVPDSGGCKEGTLSIGMMCSLSIPIITICALILLMIIVSLLDFIFRWLPFFILCFPLPGLKGKK